VSNWTKFGVGALAVAMALGCSDSTSSNTTTLTTSEKQALTQALSTTEFGSLAAFVVQTVGAVGTLDPATVSAAMTSALDGALSLSVVGTQSTAYEGAVGIAIQFDVTSGSVTQQGWFYGVFGWNDINTTNNTVGEWVLVGGTGDVGSLPTSASGTVESGDVFVYYSSAQVPHYGMTGEASVSGSTFSGNNDCSVSQQGITVDCAYSTGSMNGNFLFMAETDAGAAYTQPKVQFSGLPAVRLALTVTQ